MPTRCLFLAACILGVVPAARGAIVTYDFTGATGDQASTPATGVASGLSASVIDRGPGVTASAAANSISASGWSTSGIDLNDYYGFTLTPSGGFTLNVDSLTFSERRSATGITAISVRSSLDGFASDLFTATVPDDTLTRRQTRSQE